MTYEYQYNTAHLKSPPVQEKVESFFQRILRNGFATNEASVGNSEYQSDMESISELVDRVTQGENEDITLYYSDSNIEDPMEVDLFFLNGEPTPYVVNIALTAYYLDAQKERNPVEVVGSRSKALIQFGQYLYESFDPLHVESRGSYDAIDMRGECPFPPLAVEGVTIECPLDWYAIFRPEVVDRIGTDWLEDVELFRQEQFEDGALLVVLTDRPDAIAEMADVQERLVQNISNPGAWTSRTLDKW